MNAKTANPFSMRMDPEEYAILGRYASARGESLAQAFRRLAYKGLKEEAPAEAAKVERVRMAKAGICLSAALLVIGLQFTQHQTDPIRRTSFRNRVSIRREVVA